MRALIRLAAVVILLLWALPVEAQTRTYSAVAQCASASDKTISSNGDSFTCGVDGYASARLQTLDTYSGTWEVQCSVDGGTTFDADDELPVTLLGATSKTDEVTDTVGIWDVNVAGCTHIKIISTAGFAASDTTFAFRALATGGGSAGSGGTAGTVAISQTGNENLVDVTDNGGSLTVDAPVGTPVFVRLSDGSSAVSVATDKAEDAQHASGDTGPVVLSRRIDAAASSAGTDADYATVNTDALGLLWTRSLDPCSGVAKTVLPINISTATTTEITPSLAGASNYYYVCSLVLVTGGADNVALVDDDTDNCASVTAGMAGGTTAASGFNFAANGGMAFGNGNATIFKTNGTNRVVCLVTSAAVQLSGTMTVVAAP